MEPDFANEILDTPLNATEQIFSGRRFAKFLKSAVGGFDGPNDIDGKIGPHTIARLRQYAETDDGEIVTYAKNETNSTPSKAHEKMDKRKILFRGGFVYGGTSAGNVDKKHSDAVVGRRMAPLSLATAITLKQPPSRHWKI